MFGIEEEEETGIETLPPRGGEGTGNFAPDLEELITRVEHPPRLFPLERAILIALLIHILLLLFLIFQSYRSRKLEQREMELARLERQKEVPVRFFVEAPGPERHSEKKNVPLSDLTRKAGGGDRAKKPSENPFIATRPGIEGLASGQKERQGERGAPGHQKVSEKNSNGLNASATGAVEGETIADLQKAIARAAGAPVTGEAGAPKSNENGGFVDNGPISFDTKWYDWGSYAEEMLRKIRMNWEIPELAMIGVKGKLTVRFYIRADGTVEAEKILSSSTVPPFDFASFQAIAKSSPFLPLPKELHEEREGVTITFYYNIRPGDKE